MWISDGVIYKQQIAKSRREKKKFEEHIENISFVLLENYPKWILWHYPAYLMLGWL